MIGLFGTIAVLAVIAILAFRQASLAVWTIATTIVLLFITKYSGMNGTLLGLTWIVSAIILIPLNVKTWRIALISKRLFAIYKKSMPSMSSTEREALEAGTVSWEGDLFSGKPDFEQLFAKPTSTLTDEEQAFLDGPVNELCAMLDDWDITHNRADLPPEAWQFIKEKGFFGMIIPKSYGGLEFSATAHAAVLIKLYGRCISAATTVSVPNSLGPAELLLKYGTTEQKDHYLPRLARGEEIPCFALTGPNAGSDAASLPDKGVVCEQVFEGKKTLGVLLNWDKRYITLCPVATVIGLAFKLFDPDHLLGDKEDIGITCALIPSDTKGVVKGRRHFPLNIAFMNGPTQGKDVFIPMDYLIGGAPMAGQGWRMLMECLSAGRAISLPSGGVGGGQVAALAAGAYSRVRKQFNMPIGEFEGIEEALARIGGNTYILDAALTMTAAAIDHGAHPAVASAIVKYHTTERARALALDAMDIAGGRGICMGPDNFMARGYQTAPISITVEGANILTRCLIIYGQGAIRCHPYVFEELESALNDDVERFDAAFFAHGGMYISNFIKSFVLGISDGRMLSVRKGWMKRHLQIMGRYSACLAFMSDFSMMTLGASLKRREKISARLGDVLSLLYLASATLKRFHDEGEQKGDQVIVEWACNTLMHECETQINALVNNFPKRWMRVLLRTVVLPLGRRRTAASDKLGHKVADLLITDNDRRKNLARYVYTDDCGNNPVADLEKAFKLVIAASDLEKTLSKAAKRGQVSGLTVEEQIEDAVVKGILTKEHAAQLSESEAARQKVIAVNDFSSDELQRVVVKQSKKTKATKDEQPASTSSEEASA